MKTRPWLALALLLPLTAAAAPDEFPPPPDARVESIAPAVTTHGVTMSIRRIEVEMPLEQVISFYRDLWGDAAKEAQLPPWRMIGYIDDGLYRNVQVQPRGDLTWGYLSSSNLPELVRENRRLPLPARRFPMMSGSTVVDDQAHDDPGKRGRVVILVNDFSARSNHDFYRRHFEAGGWKILMDEQTVARGKAFALHASLGAKSISLTIADEEGRTSIIANEVNRGLLQ